MSSVNAVYYPSWRVYKDIPPSSLQLDRITHVFYAFARVNEDGTLRSLDEYCDTKKQVDGVEGCLAAVVKLKERRPALKVLLSVGGGSGSHEFPILSQTEQGRERFARSAREWVGRWGFDGVDIDWEHPSTPAQGEQYVALLRAVRAALPAPRYIVTSALPVGTWCLRNIDLRAAGECLDYVNLMGYDLAGGWSQLAGHHAQMFASKRHDAQPNVEKCCATGLDYVLEQGVQRQSVLLGVPAYARYFPGATGPGQGFRKKDAGDMDYRELPEAWIADAVVDEVSCAAYVVDTDKGFASFDVPATIRMKASFAKEQGLGGLFYWTGVGDRDGQESLVAAGFEGLGL